MVTEASADLSGDLAQALDGRMHEREDLLEPRVRARGVRRSVRCAAIRLDRRLVEGPDEVHEVVALDPEIQELPIVGQ